MDLFILMPSLIYIHYTWHIDNTVTTTVPGGNNFVEIEARVLRLGGYEKNETKFKPKLFQDKIPETLILYPYVLILSFRGNRHGISNANRMP